LHRRGTACCAPAISQQVKPKIIHSTELYSHFF
jgi:hypothetical protein